MIITQHQFTILNKHVSSIKEKPLKSNIFKKQFDLLINKYVL